VGMMSKGQDGRLKRERRRVIEKKEEYYKKM
jgi:hypothetical protein